MNKVILSGNLIKDPIAKTTNRGSEQSNFSILVSDGRSTSDSLINCITWGQNATLVNANCKQGTNVLLEGRLRISSYTKPDDGTKVYFTDVIVDNIEIISNNKLIKKEPSINTFNYDNIVNNINNSISSNIDTKNNNDTKEEDDINWDDLELFKGE